MPSKVFYFDGGDPEIRGAQEQARDTFRYFWRELAWERRRIVPGLDMSAVKAPFFDEDPEANPDAAVEHMWIADVDFDGREITGTLLNAPNELSSVNEGDPVHIPLVLLGDWMYVIGGEVFGGHTVNLMRRRMSLAERKQHDAAWGLNFGDPETIRLVPDDEEKPKGGFLKSLLGKKSAPPKSPGVIGEHPMSENCGPSFREQLLADPSMLEAPDDNGWTFLHHQSLAGSAATVKVLLEAGANVNAVTNHGMTAMDLARVLKWEKVIALLGARGAK